MYSALVAIVSVSVCVWGVIEIVKVSTKFRENMERIRYGYPTLDGSTKSHRRDETVGGEYVDMTREHNNGN